MTPRDESFEDTVLALECCRLCASTRLEPYLDLGHMPPADQFRRREDLAKPSIHYPLVVVACCDCGLSQLSCVVAPSILYQHEYPYESSTTAAGRAHFRAFAESVTRRFGFGPNDVVVDIGSNVGVLLGGFRDEGLRVVGVDPAANIASIANANGIKTHSEFFGERVVDRILAEDGSASLITGTNVFAHIHRLDELIQSVDDLLSERGV